MRGWVRRFTQRAVCGTYLRVITGGYVRAGDTITVLSRPEHDVTVETAFRALDSAAGTAAQTWSTSPRLSAEARQVAFVGHRWRWTRSRLEPR